MLLSSLLDALPIKKVSLVSDGQQVQGITYDSRQVQPGWLFVAIKGFETDGHLYLHDAVERGACALVLQEDVAVPENVAKILVEDSRKFLALVSARFFDYPSRKMKMIGITGTNGKTTTTNLINAVYREHGMKTGLIGTIQSQIGDRVLPMERTTPESTDLQRLLAEMVDEAVQAVVMEVSSHALSLHRVEECAYDTAVFTNITQDHLDYHGDMNEYLRSKSLLFAGLGRDVHKTGIQHAVVNLDDPAAQQLIRSCNVPVITYGITASAVITAQNIRVTARGVSFEVAVDGKNMALNLKLTGKFNVYNALAAVAVGVADNIPLLTIKKALEAVSGVPGRFELVDRGQDFAVVVDYAHTPDGLENVLSTAREFTTSRLITVFGCGGDRDRAKRPLMGAIASRISDLAVVTSDNPRSEEPISIIEDILAGVRGVGGDNIVIPDRREAIRYAIRNGEPGDVVVIAGKGHEDYQIIGHQKLHFDDCEEAAVVLEQLTRT